MDRRLFMNLMVLSVPVGEQPSAFVAAARRALEEEGIAAVLYADTNDPRRIGWLSWHEQPSHFVDVVRPLFEREILRDLETVPEFTMLGRTYSTGYEPDLEFWLLRRPLETVLNPEWPWAIWYPLRRRGAFGRLSGREQGSILREHAEIGRAYGEQDLAHDVRLACHGLDTQDNDFVIGLVGASLHRLSHVVQAMRKTQQTAEYIEKMGPFFVGKAIFRSPGATDAAEQRAPRK